MQTLGTSYTRIAPVTATKSGNTWTNTVSWCTDATWDGTSNCPGGGAPNTYDFLSDGHFFAPHVAPNGEFEFTFTEAGDYYYICYIHKSMIGKIRVE